MIPISEETLRAPCKLLSSFTVTCDWIILKRKLSFIACGHSCVPGPAQSRIWTKMQNSIWDPLQDHLRDSLRAQVQHLLREGVWDSVWDELWDWLQGEMLHCLPVSLWENLQVSPARNYRFIRIWIVGTKLLNLIFIKLSICFFLCYAGFFQAQSQGVILFSLWHWIPYEFSFTIYY